MAAQKRKITLIRPVFQFKIILVFLCVALCCMLIQTTLVLGAFTAVSATITLNPSAFDATVSSILWNSTLVALALLVPFSIAIGTLVTFRIAGPVYRFEQYFKGLKEGTITGPCQLRDRDEFAELCKRINEVMEAKKVFADAAESTEKQEVLA